MRAGYSTKCRRARLRGLGSIDMWTTIEFKTRAELLAWVKNKSHKYRWHEIFINNGYAVECKPLVDYRMPR